MKKLKIMCAALILVAALGAGGSALAANENLNDINEAAAQTQAATGQNDEKMKEIRNKWDKLSEKQKNEVYALFEEKCASDAKILDKYVEFGLIDKPEADKIKERSAQRTEELKKSGKMPLFVIKYKKR